MAFGTSLENYFLLTVPKSLQIGGTFLVFVVTGGITGAVGMLMNWGLFKFGYLYLPDGAAGMSIYRFYYLAVGIIFALGILLPYSLPGKKSQQ